MIRTQRRLLKAKAPRVAAKLARRCYDFQGKEIVPVTDPLAIGALTSTFTRLLRAEGRPVSLPLSEAEARAFPRSVDDATRDSRTWLSISLHRHMRAGMG